MSHGDLTSTMASAPGLLQCSAPSAPSSNTLLKMLALTASAVSLVHKQPHIVGF